MLEELASSPEFREWFLAKLSVSMDVPPYTQARVRKNEQREAEIGQTDLGLALLDAAGNELCLVLIENKVRSAFQEGQAGRYRDEVHRARTKLGLRRAAAVLIAPENNHYVRQDPGHRVFDADVTIEAIIKFMEARAEELLRAEKPGQHADEIASRLRSKVVFVDLH